MNSQSEEMLELLSQSDSFAMLRAQVKSSFGVDIEVSSAEPWVLRGAQYFAFRSDDDDLLIDQDDKDVVTYKCTIDLIHGDVAFGSVRISSDQFEAAMSGVAEIMEPYMIDNLDRIEVPAERDASRIITLLDGESRRSFVVMPGQSIFIMKQQQQAAKPKTTKKRMVAKRPDED